MNALEMFRMGNDYLQIAAHSGGTEAEVEKEIHALRAEELLIYQKVERSLRRAEARRIYQRERMRRERAERREMRAGA